MLSLRRLQLLQATVRTGSLSGAARELGYTQPAVSHHIARLEEEVGTTLLVRLGRGVQLTDAGRVLAAHADAILARAVAAEEDVAAIAGLRGGHVGLAAFPSGCATLLPTALTQLRAAYPDVAVSLVEAEPPEAVLLLRSGDVDVVVGFRYDGMKIEEGRDHARVPLLDDPLHAVLPPHHPLAERAVVELADLADATWIAGCERCRLHLVHACAKAGFEPRIAFAIDDGVTVQSLVAAGQGVAVLPALILHAVRLPTVVVRPLATPSVRRVEAVVHAAERRPPAVAAMVAALGEASALIAAGAVGELGLEAVG